jgi:hypothetical protein
MEPIPANIVEETWKRVASLSPRRAPGLIKQMGKEQPVILAHLLAIDHDLFNDDERQLLLYLGIVVWQMMSQGSHPLPMITEDRLDAIEANNLKLVEYLQGETEEGFLEVTRSIINNYGQPQVLRYAVEAIMEEPAEGCVIRDESRGIMLLDLKTVIDCFDV